jgi:hypothetical protein
VICVQLYSGLEINQVNHSKVRGPVTSLGRTSLAEARPCIHPEEILKLQTQGPSSKFPHAHNHNASRHQPEAQVEELLQYLIHNHMEWIHKRPRKRMEEEWFAVNLRSYF